MVGPRLQRARYVVIGWLALLFAVTYLDRVCISVAGPRMQEDLHIGPAGWGWVGGVFTLSYCVFEFPTGALGDRLGPRRILTRIVLWWSAFTALTGAVVQYPMLLATRFLFGAGEAGAFPNAGVVVTKWFPSSQRATLCGINLAAAQIGGALAPLLVVPIQMRFGWRASFFVFGALGLIWALGWYLWFRDTPAEKLGVREEPEGAPERPFPMREALKSQSVHALLALGFCYVYVYNFFQTWFHTFLVKGRGSGEDVLLLSALPYLVAVCGNLCGGTLSDALVARIGRKNGRRMLGVGAMLTAAVFIIATTLTHAPIATIMLLSAAYGAITLQQSVAFGACLDLGSGRAGAMTGLFNTACQIGGLLGSVVYGYLVEASGSYDAPFFPMAALLLLGALMWWRLDATRPVPGSSSSPPAVRPPLPPPPR